jgi:hypothetical protein
MHDLASMHLCPAAAVLVLCSVLLHSASGHDFDSASSRPTAEASESDVCWTPQRYYAPETFDWVEHVHVVSMTHFDAAGWGPPSAAAPGAREETTQVNSGKYTRDVCDSYTGSQGQASGGYLAAALAVAEELQNAPAPPPPPPQHDTCWPGHARSVKPADYDCPGWTEGFESTDCEAVGCCVDAELYSNRSNGWCYPSHKPAVPMGKPAFIYSTHPWIVQEYFNATASCGSPQRNATMVAAVEAGVRAGTFAWQGKPFTIIHELADPQLYTWSLGIVRVRSAHHSVTCPEFLDR